MSNDYEIAAYEKTKYAHVYKILAIGGKVWYTYEDETGGWQEKFDTAEEAKTELFKYFNWLEGL